MHELRMGGSQSTRGPSPTNSQKSKKSTRSDRFANRANKHRRNPSNSDSRPASRPQSRNNSRSNNNNNNSRSSRNYRGSSRGRRRSISTEDEVDSDDAVVNDFSQSHLDEDEDDEEDFFTGESDNDFVSLSSGSNSRRAPRKSWTCEHCTYVNNPGVTVCNMCCRTSKYSRGDDQLFMNSDRANSRNSNRGTKKQKLKKTS